MIKFFKTLSVVTFFVLGSFVTNVAAVQGDYLLDKEVVPNAAYLCRYSPWSNEMVISPDQNESLSVEDFKELTSSQHDQNIDELEVARIAEEIRSELQDTREDESFTIKDSGIAAAMVSPTQPLTPSLFWFEFSALKQTQRYTEAFMLANKMLGSPLEAGFRNTVILLLAEMGVYRQTCLLNDKTTFALLDVLGSSPETPSKWQIASQYYKALLRFKRRIECIDDEEAFSLFQKVSQHKDLSYHVQAQATLYMAKMVIKKRVAAYSDQDMFIWLRGISGYYGFNPRAAIIARYYMAWLRVHGRTRYLSLAESFEYLDEVSKSEHAPAKVQANAQYYKALLRLNCHIEVISDDMAACLLGGLIGNATITEGRRIKAKNLYALMRFTRRTGLINDEKAFEWFDESSCHPDLTAKERAAAQLAKAIMRHEWRTEALTDVGAVAILFSVFNVEMEPPFLVEMAKYNVALMYSENRADSVSENKAHELLWQVFMAGHAPKWLRSNSLRLLSVLLNRSLIDGTTYGKATPSRFCEESEALEGNLENLSTSSV